MSAYRQHLPQLSDSLFLTDGGLETTLIFHEGTPLPCFAAFTLLRDEAGTAALERYFARYAALARSENVGLVLESPTWRANPDWASKLGYTEASLADANRRAIALLARVRAAYEAPATPIVISGNLGPRGDGYRADTRMSADEARAYHQPQIETFAATEADMVAAFTINYVEEAIGAIRAAKACEMPVAISFTLETDGRLPSGESLRDAIERVDDATNTYAAYFMINCAHPSHFVATLSAEGTWRERIRGVRANASKRSHAELDEADDLDDGDPDELGRDYVSLRRVLPRMSVVGGCCGTDERHIGRLCHFMKKELAHDSRVDAV